MGGWGLFPLLDGRKHGRRSSGLRKLEQTMTVRKLLFLAALASTVLLGGCANQLTFGQGKPECWIRIYSQKAYEGDSTQIYGPVELATLMGVPRHSLLRRWQSNIESIEMGPGAWAEVYKDRNFTGAVHYFGPGTRAAELRSIDFEDSIYSMKIFDARPAHWPAEAK